MQALTHCDVNVMNTRTTVSQLKGQFKSQFKGAMEDMSGKVQKANTHSTSSFTLRMRRVATVAPIVTTSPSNRGFVLEIPPTVVGGPPRTIAVLMAASTIHSAATAKPC